MLGFKAQAAITIPLHRKGILTPAIARQLCIDHRDSGSKPGCYVFAVPRKRADGWLPIYVGRATGSLIDEAMSADKMNKLNEYLADNPAAELRLHLITHPTQRGRTNESVIAEMELFLISRVAEVNPKLINKHGTKPQQWEIIGVTRDGRGKRSASAQALRNLLGFGDDVAPRVSATAPVDTDQ